MKAWHRDGTGEADPTGGGEREQIAMTDTSALRAPVTSTRRIPSFSQDRQHEDPTSWNTMRSVAKLSRRMIMNKTTLLSLLVYSTCCTGQSLAQKLEVTEAGKSPARRLTVNVAGAYRAVISQETGGGISEFYDLVADPEAKSNLTGR